MADVTYRANLKASSFPLLSELHGRSVIVRGQDQNYIPGLAAKESIDSAAGIPQIYYCHNVVPTDSGYKSVAYNTLVEGTMPESANPGDVHTLRNSYGDVVLLTVTAAGSCYILKEGADDWMLVTGPVPSTIEGAKITTAFISGITYVFFSGIGCYVYDFTNDTLEFTELTGLDIPYIKGIVGNYGYMIAYSDSGLAWSSVTNPTDFVPSLETGAGGGQLEALKGTIVTVESLYGGMIVFGSENCLACEYSGNPRYPYKFVALPGAGGLEDASYVTSDSGNGMLYAYTKSGLQSFTLRSVQVVFHEITDFLSGGLFETFNTVTSFFDREEAEASTVLKRLVLVADRYLILSYGIGRLTDAVYYDTALKQFGRLQLPHTECFELNSHATDLPKKSIAFLNSNGGIKVLDASLTNPNSNGVLILGKFQYVRSRTLQLQGVEFENVSQGDSCKVYDMPSLDGKNPSTIVEGYLHSSVLKNRAYKFHVTGTNHSIVIVGSFHAVSVLLTFNIAGAR